MKQKKLLNWSPGNKDRPKGVRVSTAPSRAQPCDLTPSHNPYLPAFVSALLPTLPQTRGQVFNTWDLKRFLSTSEQEQRSKAEGSLTWPEMTSPEAGVH